MTSSNQHYGYDDDESHLQHRHHFDGRGHHASHHDINESSCDPCQTNTACMEACQAMSSVDQTMTMCGIPNRLSQFRPSNYFNRNLGGDHEDDPDHHSSPYLYSPSAPVGPTTCEYCGNRNTDHCTSNLPEEYMLFMDNINATNNEDNKHPKNRSDKKRNNSSNYGTNDDVVCSRPKLFFLKKRPPFATPDGWNPVTEYRSNLFEPPTSVEGMGRGWGEVRGHLGNSERTAGGSGGGGGIGLANNNNPTATTSATATATATSSANGNANRNSYANSGCGSSACGGGAVDTEISFSSAGGGGGADRGTNVSAGERSLSPVQWVSGLMEALSPS